MAGRVVVDSLVVVVLVEVGRVVVILWEVMVRVVVLEVVLVVFVRLRRLRCFVFGVFDLVRWVSTSRSSSTFLIKLFHQHVRGLLRH